MSIRTDILANVTTRLSGTSCKTSQELPWESGDVPLHIKNMKTFYLDAAGEDINQLIPTLDNSDVYSKTVSVTGYLSVDAKNPPTDIDAIVTSCIAARNVVTGQIYNLCDVTTEIEADILTYIFEYELESVLTV